MGGIPLIPYIHTLDQICIIMCREGCHGICSSQTFKNKCNSWEAILEANRLAVKNLKTLLQLDSDPEISKIVGNMADDHKKEIFKRLGEEEKRLENISEDRSESPYQFGVIPQQEALKEKLASIKEEIEKIYSLEKVSA